MAHSSSKFLLIVLSISLLINGFLIGRLWIPNPLEHKNADTKFFLLKMPYHKTHRLYPYAKPDLDQIRPLIKEIYKEKKQTMQIFQKEPFNKEEAMSALEHLREKQAELRKHADETLLNTYVRLSDEEKGKLLKAWFEKPHHKIRKRKCKHELN